MHLVRPRWLPRFVKAAIAGFHLSSRFTSRKSPTPSRTLASRVSRSRSSRAVRLCDWPIVLRALLTALALAIGSIAEAAGAQFTPRANGVDVSNGSATLRITALSDSILRVRLTPDGQFGEDASWAVPAEVRGKSVSLRSTADGFQTGQIAVRIDPATLQLTVSDLRGRLISADLPAPVTFAAKGFTLRKALPPGTRIYGLGDKTGNFDRLGQSFVNWNTDSWGFTRGTDPIYKSIPFYISTGNAGGAYGMFLDNSWRSWFDFGHRDVGTIEIGAAGAVDYYLIAGPTVREVVRRYTDVTGKAPLPPSWALGFQQSRYSYMSADEVRQIATRLRSDRIPSDVIWLDIDFQDRNRPFTTNRKPSPT